LQKDDQSNINAFYIEEFLLLPEGVAKVPSPPGGCRKSPLSPRERVRVRGYEVTLNLSKFTKNANLYQTRTQIYTCRFNLKLH